MLLSLTFVGVVSIIRYLCLKQVLINYSAACHLQIQYCTRHLCAWNDNQIGAHCICSLYSCKRKNNSAYDFSILKSTVSLISFFPFEYSQENLAR